MTRSLLPLAFVASFATPLAAQDLPFCADGVVFDIAADDLLDDDGYPLQQFTAQTMIPATASQPCLDTYVFRVESDGDTLLLQAPNAILTYEGQWERLGVRRVATDGQSEVFSFTNGTTITEEIAREASVGLSVAASSQVAPFGVGVDITVAASVGYAETLTNGTANREDWTHTVTVHPGEEVVIWARQITVRASWDPTDRYPLTEAGARAFFEEVYYPALAQDFVAQGMDEEEALAGINSPFFILRGFMDTEPLLYYESLLQQYDAPFERVYTLPFLETYTVRYQY